MNDASAYRDAVEQLAEEFVERWRRGERPSVNEYADSHPNHADRIRRLFPAILLAENMGIAEVDHHQAPKSLGEYRIIREIGRGGMGVVYEAVQEPLGRQVALKVLAGTMADPRFRERFQREARAAARLHHTNIVPVFGVGEHDGTLYYAMQYIAGHGLDELLREVLLGRGQAGTRLGADITPKSEQRIDATPQPKSKTSPSSSGLLSTSQAEYHRGVALIGMQVAAALDYAHGQGVLHRDIKPSNLLMDAAGTVWVTDFGLAKTDDEVGLTHSGDFVGTMRFMAPERFRGESGPSCDVYSLGVTLYEMLTFRPAFDDTDRAKLLDQIHRREPTPPRSIDPRVPRDLETIVQKAMSKDAVHRYSTAQAMADDLHEFLADRPITARRANLGERALRWCRRNPILAALSSAVALLALVILIGSPIMSLKLWRQKQDALDKLWHSNLSQAKAERLTDEAGRRTAAIQSLDAALQILPSLPSDPKRRLEMRNEYFASLALPDLTASSLRTMPPGTAAITFDATFAHYARGDEKGAVSIRRASDDSEVVRLPEQGIPAWGLKFSPDGRFIAVGYRRKYETCSQKFRVWNVHTGQQLLAVDSQVGCGDADYSPDSRFVAFSRDSDVLAIHDLKAEGAPAKSHEVSSMPTAIAFHPDGKKLAVAFRRTIETRDFESGKVLVTRQAERDVWAMAWHPEGEILAAASGSSIALWAEDNPQPVTTLRGHEHLISALAFHPDGELLASKSNDGSIRLWEVNSRKQLVRTPSVYAGCVPIQFSADGSRFGFATDGSQFWTFDVNRGRECRVLVPPRAANNLSALSADFSPDSRLVAIGSVDGVRMWNCDTGCLVGFTPVRAARVVRFTKDGASLLTGGQSDLQRWSLSYETLDGEFLVNPVSLSKGEAVVNFVLGRDSDTLVVRHRDQSPRVLLANRPEEVVILGEHPRMRYITLSADGKLVATGNEFGSGVRIWDAATGKMVRELPTDSSASAEFSPDGRWLVVGTESKYTFFDVGTWLPHHELTKEPESTAGDISFSADGKIVVVRYSPNQLRIADPATGAELATLHAPGHHIMSWHRISADGRRLAAAGAGNAMYLWDVAGIREQLSQRTLDW